MFSNTRRIMARCLANISGITYSALVNVDDIAADNIWDVILEPEHRCRSELIFEGKPQVNMWYKFRYQLRNGFLQARVGF